MVAGDGVDLDAARRELPPPQIRIDVREFYRFVPRLEERHRTGILMRHIAGSCVDPVFQLRRVVELAQIVAPRAVGEEPRGLDTPADAAGEPLASGPRAVPQV